MARRLTRDGEFHLNATGQLTTKQGNLVLGTADRFNSIQSWAGTSPFPHGRNQSGAMKYGSRLKVVDFNQPNDLRQVGGGCFVATTPGMQPIEAPLTKLRRGGFLEGANTSPTMEMASLIGVMRGFEANQRMMRIHGDRMSRTISSWAIRTEFKSCYAHFTPSASGMASQQTNLDVIANNRRTSAPPASRRAKPSSGSAVFLDSRGGAILAVVINFPPAWTSVTAHARVHFEDFHRG